MYLIAVYDVESKKCPKYMKVLRKYLFHTQNSVFDGELTDKEFKNLKLELMKIGIDNVKFYIINSKKTLHIMTIGDELENRLIF